jgi:DNA-binding MarR family transcriptional regulator
MEDKKLVYREKNPIDGRGIFIKITELRLEIINTSKEHVIKFNETIRKHISEEKINHFFEVTQTINKLINEKIIFNNKPTK